MEHSLNLAKAKEISAYITAKYGLQNLGIVRLLSSVPYFRQAVFRNKLPELLGMSLISFEKYLREQHHIFYRYDGSTFNVERLSGGAPVRVAAYEDDCLFSVGGAVVEQIVDLYPDGESLSRVPMVSMGRGFGVDSMLAVVDIQAVCAYIKRLPESYVDDTIVSDIHNYGALVADPDESKMTPVDKYKAVDALHKLYVRFRLTPPDVRDICELPPCSKEEFMEVVMGVKRASVMAPEGGRIPKTLLDSLKETWPEGEVRGGSFILTGEAVLDPFKYIGSSAKDIALPDLADIPVVVKPVKTGQTSSVAETTTSPGCVGVVPASFGDAVDLVLQYVDTNINDMEPAEKEIALYGYVGGEANFKKMSTAAQKNLTKVLCVGDHESTEVIAKLATAIRSNLRYRNPVTDAQAALMAAGRIVAWKGNWLIEPSGIWRKIK